MNKDNFRKGWRARIYPPTFDGGKFLFEIRDGYDKFAHGGELFELNMAAAIDRMINVEEIEYIEIASVQWIKVT